MSNTINGLVVYDENNYKLINKFRLKKAEKAFNINQIKQKRSEIELVLIKLGSREIMKTILNESKTESVKADDDILNSLISGDTETQERKNKIIQCVNNSVSDEGVKQITSYLIQLSTEAIQLELISGNPLISQLN